MEWYWLREETLEQEEREIHAGKILSMVSVSAEEFPRCHLIANELVLVLFLSFPPLYFVRWSQIIRVPAHQVCACDDREEEFPF